MTDTSHIACVDDVSLLMPGWLDSVSRACRTAQVVAGAYMTVRDMRVGNGELTGWSGFDVDSRWHMADLAQKVPLSGGGLYGCTFCLPLSAVEAVNGFDEYCDGIGLEDYDLGLRLERAGFEIFYNREMMILKAMDKEQLLVRRSKTHTDGSKTDHYLLNRLLEDPRRTGTLGTWCDIREQRRRVRRGHPIEYCLPDQDWVDGQPLAEL